MDYDEYVDQITQLTQGYYSLSSKQLGSYGTFIQNMLRGDAEPGLFPTEYANILKQQHSDYLTYSNSAFNLSVDYSQSVFEEAINGMKQDKNTPKPKRKAPTAKKVVARKA